MTSAEDSGEEIEALLEPGSVLGAYRIERHLASGGMAHVYVAEHVGLGKRVAVKVLKAKFTTQEEFRQRFLREGMAASIIRHPNVVDVHDVREESGRVYLVMELLEGESLEDLLRRRGVLKVDRAIDLMLPVIAALGAAHEQGVVHRDLKPENVFITRDLAGREQPKVLDFGISKIRRVETFTVTQSVLGTPHYMSPEQARGELDLDGRSDQFSAAMVLYELVTGRLPYVSESIIKLIHEVARGDVPAPRTFNDELPVEIDDVVMRALRNEPADRYASMEAFGRALLPFASSRGQDEWSGPFANAGRRFLPSEPPPSLTGARRAPDAPRRARDEETTLARPRAMPDGAPDDEGPRTSSPVGTASGPVLGSDGLSESQRIAGALPAVAAPGPASRRRSVVFVIGGALVAIALLVWWLTIGAQGGVVASAETEVRAAADGPATPDTTTVVAPPEVVPTERTTVESTAVAAPSPDAPADVQHADEPEEASPDPPVGRARPTVRRPPPRPRSPAGTPEPARPADDDLRFSR